MFVVEAETGLTGRTPAGTYGNRRLTAVQSGLKDLEYFQQVHAYRPVKYTLRRV